MDIVDFWDKQTAQWQEDQKCGFCWEFEAPLKESQANIIQNQSDECCVYVILTDLSENDVPKFSPNSGLISGVNQDHAFTIHFVSKGDMGTNNYTEIKGHPKSESRWETIYKPIKTCLDESDLLEAFCLYVGLKVDVTQWRKEISHAYLDNKYFGWKIRATFRVEK